MSNLYEELKEKQLTSELSNDEEMVLILNEVYEVVDNDTRTLEEIPEEDWEIVW